MISDLFRKRPGVIGLSGRAEVSTFTPKCDDCQKYRNLIKQANDIGNQSFADLMRKDLEAHCTKEHSHA